MPIWWCKVAPIPISEAQLDDLRRIVLRTINKNQVLILTNIPRVPASITSVLRGISRKYHVPLSTLKRNAQILRELNLIRYGEAPNFSGVELTELGHFISELTASEEPTKRVSSSMPTEMKKIAPNVSRNGRMSETA